MKQCMSIIMIAVLLIFIVAPVSALPPKGDAISPICYNSSNLSISDDHGFGGEDGMPQKSPTPQDGWVYPEGWLHWLRVALTHYFMF